jgi:hypothetical protein
MNLWAVYGCGAEDPRTLVVCRVCVCVCSGVLWLADTVPVLALKLARRLLMTLARLKVR